MPHWRYDKESLNDLKPGENNLENKEIKTGDMDTFEVEMDLPSFKTIDTNNN